MQVKQQKLLVRKRLEVFEVKRENDERTEIYLGTARGWLVKEKLDHMQSSNAYP
jgi:hypothetical protein